MPIMYAKRSFSPYGKAVRAGDPFEVHSEQEANVLVHIGYASRYSTAGEPLLHDWAELVQVADETVKASRRKRTYKRRDLQAEE